jgi:lipopolysaccharide/colanic/teichoic acid biosynthesis glycosyltransferase
VPHNQGQRAGILNIANGWFLKQPVIKLQRGMREMKLLNFEELEKEISSKQPQIIGSEKVARKKSGTITKDFVPRKEQTFEEAILQESSIPVLKFISDHLGGYTFNKVIIPHTYGPINSQALIPLKIEIQNNNVRAIIDFVKTNQKRYINKYFEAINSMLPKAGIFVGCVETTNQRNKRVYGSRRKWFSRMAVFAEFIAHRVLPRMESFKKLYFAVTKGRYRYLSAAETLGRLVSCGFDIIEYKEIRNQTYFVVMKTREPYFDKSPSYGPLVKLKRIGKDGKIIRVYKFRTMHPYSEYIQDFVIKLNGYNAVGKPANDFRLTSWGKFFRKYWLDEVPQLINVFKGEMRLMGVRPLSRVRFSEFPADMQKERIKYKPGCIPPYVALNMPDEDGNIEAERIYLKDKKEHPVWTDILYVLRALRNIIGRKITSS